MEQEIRKLLSQIVHPETQQSIVDSGVLERTTGTSVSTLQSI